MSQDRLFHVSPEAIHSTVYFDRFSSSWRVRVCTTKSNPEGGRDVELVNVYEELTAQEAVDVLVAEYSVLFGL